VPVAALKIKKFLKCYNLMGRSRYCDWLKCFSLTLSLPVSVLKTKKLFKMLQSNANKYMMQLLSQLLSAIHSQATLSSPVAALQMGKKFLKMPQTTERSINCNRSDSF
jgi:hypothetical protein